MRNKEKKYEDYFKDMCDEERETRREMHRNKKNRVIERELIVELFKINGSEQKLTVIREPYDPDVSVYLTKNEIIDIMTKYNYFLTNVKDGIATFSEDMNNESIAFMRLRAEYQRDFSKYY